MLKKHTLLIKNGILLTMNDSMEIIENGAVYIENDVIEAIGKTEEIC